MTQKFTDPSRRPRGFDEKLEFFINFKNAKLIDFPIKSYNVFLASCLILEQTKEF